MKLEEIKNVLRTNMGEWEEKAGEIRVQYLDPNSKLNTEVANARAALKGSASNVVDNINDILDAIMGDLQNVVTRIDEANAAAGNYINTA